MLGFFDSGDVSACIKPLFEKATDGSNARRIGLARWYLLEVGVDGNFDLQPPGGRDAGDWHSSGH